MQQNITHCKRLMQLLNLNINITFVCPTIKVSTLA